MSRHSRNNTANSIFTYYERKKVQGFGTQKTLLGEENFRKFEDCWLCLRTAVRPVCTPSGFIYCRECIVANLGEQKEHYDRQVAEWELRQHLKLEAAKEQEKLAKKREIQEFLHCNDRVPTSTKTIRKPRSDKLARRITTEEAEREKATNRATSFWIAENSPAAGGTGSSKVTPGQEHEDSKPVRELRCPISKKRLRLKDLIDLKTDVASFEEESGNLRVVWVCGLTKRNIGFKKACVIKRTGQVILYSCLKEGLLKGLGEGGRDLEAKDLVVLACGGSGFASHNKIEAKVHRPVLE